MLAILSTDVLPGIRMSVDDYLKADLPEGHRYELVEGVVQMVPPPEMPHDGVVERFHDLFSAYKIAHPDIVSKITQRGAVAIPGRDTAREPDFAVYGPASLASTGDSAWQDVTPVLVIEVISAGQESRDYVDKRHDYWSAGVPSYWIADRQRPGLTVLTRGAAAWEETFLTGSQTYRPPQFPGLECHVGRVLGL